MKDQTFTSQTILDDNELTAACCRILARQIASLKLSLTEITTDVHRCHLTVERQRNEIVHLQEQKNQEKQKLDDARKRTDKLKSLCDQMKRYLVTLTKEKKAVTSGLDKRAYDSQMMRYFIDGIDDKSKYECPNSNNISEKTYSTTRHNRRSSWMNNGGLSLRHMFLPSNNNGKGLDDRLKGHKKERSKSLIIGKRSSFYNLFDDLSRDVLNSNNSIKIEQKTENAKSA